MDEACVLTGRQRKEQRDLVLILLDHGMTMVPKDTL